MGRVGVSVVEGPGFPAGFFEQDALVVARALLGAELSSGGVVVRITETEAYREDDSACHAFTGRTKRNAALFGPPAHWYVYLCYGIHRLINVVTGPEGHAAAVLIRSAEPVRGLATIRRRRRGLNGPTLLNGPGKLGQGLGAKLEHTGDSVVDGALHVRPGEAPSAVLIGPRIGIDYAQPEDRDAPWRFASAGTKWVGHRRRLRAE
ncbi:MAG: DNA-3-methyladenine glycosylase [Myxococcota bacterium]